jgi:hypothetical protein
MKRISRGITRSLIFAAPMLLVASLASAAGLDRLSAEFQSPPAVTTGTNSSVFGEIFTTATPILSGAGFPGGTVVYDKTLNIPPGVAYITFSAQGDTHDGAALLMSASITDSSGTTVCSPMATAGGAALFKAPWMTLLKLPADSGATNNCGGGAGDGGGGPGDCHDNNIFFSCCALVSGDPSRDVQIRLASSTGGRVFYEDSTIYIDRGPNAGGGFCANVGTAAH